VGSHEPAGLVVELGPDAEKEGKIKIGDRVGSTNTFGFCGACSSCRQGKQLCENIKGLLGLTVSRALKPPTPTCSRRLARSTAASPST
jgi:D-arabinose 1-dehydrogenase-like Zn-dependent alcohol dehydrogenase